MALFVFAEFEASLMDYVGHRSMHGVDPEVALSDAINRPLAQVSSC